MNTHPTLTLAMDFPERLTQLRKQRKLTQAALADAVEVHVTQIRRYEAGNAQPTLDVIRRLAIALSTSADTLVFPNNDQGPTEDLNLHLEAINQLDEDEQQTIRHLIEGALLRHQAKKNSPANRRLQNPTPALPRNRKGQRHSGHQRQGP